MWSLQIDFIMGSLDTIWRGKQEEEKEKRIINKTS